MARIGERIEQARVFVIRVAERIVIPRKGHRRLFIAGETLLFILPRGTLRGSVNEKCIKTSPV